MTLFELQHEISSYKRIVHESWDDGVNYIIKSTIPDSSLVYCDFMSMQLKPFTPTCEELFSDNWKVME